MNLSNFINSKANICVEATQPNDLRISEKMIEASIRNKNVRTFFQNKIYRITGCRSSINP